MDCYEFYMQFVDFPQNTIGDGSHTNVQTIFSIHGLILLSSLYYDKCENVFWIHAAFPNLETENVVAVAKLYGELNFAQRNSFAELLNSPSNWIQLEISQFIFSPATSLSIRSFSSQPSWVNLLWCAEQQSHSRGLEYEPTLMANTLRCRLGCIDAGLEAHISAGGISASNVHDVRSRTCAREPLNLFHFATPMDGR